MNIYLIKASAQSAFKEYKKYMGSPPQSIFSLAATTPKGVGIEMVDETMDMKVNYRSNADVVAIFASTPDILRAYEIAKKFRKKGKTVVLAGLHVTFMPDEAQQHADTIIVGEAEGVWEQLLEDYRAGSLLPRYQRTEPVDVATLKPFSTQLIDKSWYGNAWTVMVSRGCVYHCSYCVVTPFFNKGMRYRPVGQIVDEIKNSGAKWIELHSDHLMGDPDYIRELLTALIPLNIQWMGETTVNMAKDEELLQLAAKSGMRYILVGLETPSQDALKKAGKGFVKVQEVKEYIRRYHEYNVVVDSAQIFGFDQQDKSIFERSLEFINEVGVDVPHAVLLIPFPGTRTFSQLDTEGRLLTKDWSKYDGNHVVFQPKLMTPKELKGGQNWFWYYAKRSKLAKKLEKEMMW
ncbi:MAG: B12-binding domain-containing radical SAM protein [Anaerolineae bacterium]|jgi:radical SAM superfamily enzyme YgiQ (UPF0313 family)|nr:B12-binding domain-containing radical SAM protein [Anaerolineae bacterium]MBT7192239.1 B12-binding domain-containing radical SAM protein [Anaerolineae bacterium]